MDLSQGVTFCHWLFHFFEHLVWVEKPLQNSGFNAPIVKTYIYIYIYIPIFCECFSFIWRCIFPVSILMILYIFSKPIWDILLNVNLDMSDKSDAWLSQGYLRLCLKSLRKQFWSFKILLFLCIVISSFSFSRSDHLLALVLQTWCLPKNLPFYVCTAVIVFYFQIFVKKLSVWFVCL